MTTARRWADEPAVDIDQINHDVLRGEPTVDVIIYYPNNLDPEHATKVTPELLIEGFGHAKRVFGAVGVQLRLLGFKTGPLDPRLFEVKSTPGADLPRGRFVNTYRAAERSPSVISSEAEAAFRAIIADAPGAERVVHLVTLEDVFMEFFEQLDFRTWQKKIISTGGLSFPAYMYGDTMPRYLRGVITITDLTKNEDSWKTIAHELGHKLLNVSHEHGDIGPQHEVNSDVGLMFYGSGTEIARGRTGRFHYERLHRSPYVYLEDGGGARSYNPDYAGGGFYYDPIYEGVTVDLDAETAGSG